MTDNELIQDYAKIGAGFFRLGKLNVGWLLQINPNLCATTKQKEYYQKTNKIKFTQYEK